MEKGVSNGKVYLKSKLEIAIMQCYCEQLKKNSQIYKVDCFRKVYVGDFF